MAEFEYPVPGSVGGTGGFQYPHSGDESPFPNPNPGIAVMSDVSLYVCYMSDAAP